MAQGNSLHPSNPRFRLYLRGLIPDRDSLQVLTGNAFQFTEFINPTFYEKGELIIAKLTAEGYEEIDRTKVIKPTNTAFGRDVVWSMPAFANKKVFIRNDDEIICLDLEKKQKPIKEP